jgi:hypothetical protein
MPALLTRISIGPSSASTFLTLAQARTGDGMAAQGREGVRFEQTWKERVMAFFSLGSGNRRAKPGRVQRFEQADCVVVKAFADLRKARYLKSNQFPGISLGAVQRS